MYLSPLMMEDDYGVATDFQLAGVRTNGILSITSPLLTAFSFQFIYHSFVFPSVAFVHNSKIVLNYSMVTCDYELCVCALQSSA